MTAAGWLLMLLSCGSVTAVMAFCYWRLLRSDARMESDSRRSAENAEPP